jgi:hypothetical protein
MKQVHIGQQPHSSMAGEQALCLSSGAGLSP